MRWLAFIARSSKARTLISPLLRTSRQRQLRDGGAVLARIGSAVVHAGGEVAHHRLAAAEGIRIAVVQVDDVALGFELGAHIAGNAIFDVHVAAGER